MRFLIVAANLCTDPYPVYPLGMSVIAAAAEQAGHTVRQFDLLAHGTGRLAEAITEFQPEAIGISIRNLDTVNSRSNEKDLLKTPLKACGICRRNSQAPIILGGPGFSLLPEKIMQLTGADYGIVGEGEDAAIQLLAELEAGKIPEKKLRHGRTPLQSAALYQDDIMEFYYRETHIIPIQTKRGCPFACAYCTYPALEGHAIRERNAEMVVSQLQELSGRYPDAMFYFVDAVFNDPDRNYYHILQRIRKEKIRIPFAAFLSPFRLTEADIGLMDECGMIAAELGIDAATDETLRGIHKNFTFQEAKDAAGLLLKHGIGVTANVMFGGPGETYETAGKGIGNLRSLEPAHTLVFSGIRIIPDTPLCRIAEKEGKIPSGWDGAGELYYFADGLEPELLHSMLAEGFRGSRCCVYPPDAKNNELKLLHKLGYAKMRKMKIGAEQ